MQPINELLPDLKLKFNIEHPALEDCYVFGYEAALSEVSEENNPFAPGTKENEQWSEGWWAGFYMEEPLFDLRDPLSEGKNFHAANDDSFHHSKLSMFIKILELTGAIAISALIGYQMIELVA